MYFYAETLGPLYRGQNDDFRFPAKKNLTIILTMLGVKFQENKNSTFLVLVQQQKMKKSKYFMSTVHGKLYLYSHLIHVLSWRKYMIRSKETNPSVQIFFQETKQVYHSNLKNDQISR